MTTILDRCTNSIQSLAPRTVIPLISSSSYTIIIEIYQIPNTIYNLIYTKYNAPILSAPHTEPHIAVCEHISKI